VAALGIYFRGHLELKLNVVITFIKIRTTPCEFEPPYVEQVYCDNQSTISMTKNPVFHNRTKHIDIRHHFIRELVQQEFLFFEFCKSEDQLADIFTKALPKDRLETLRSQLGILKLDIKGEIEGINA
jgi:hypothetical protein